MKDRVQNCSADSIAHDGKKHSNQLAQIMDLLRSRGERGATSEELYAIARRFGGRLFEARRLGAIIEVRQLSAGLFLYILRRDMQTAPDRAPLTHEPLPGSSTTLPLFAGVQR